MKFEDILAREFNELLEMNDPVDKQIKSIARMTDQNDHNGSILAGLKMMGNDSLVKKLINDIESIIDKHDELGHMPSELTSSRALVYTKMMKIAKKRLGDKYKAFHGAF